MTVRISAPALALALAALGAAARPASALADDKAALIQETRGFSRMHSFRVAIDYDTGAQSIHSTMIVIEPDRMRIDASANGITATRVTIGKLNWVKYGSGKWEKIETPQAADPLANIHDPNALAKTLAGDTVKFLGSRQLDGQTMHVYQYALPPKKGFSSRVSEIWIGASDGFPHKLVQANGPLKATLTYSGFNTQMSISGPE